METLQAPWKTKNSSKFLEIVVVTDSFINDKENKTNVQKIIYS